METLFNAHLPAIALIYQFAVLIFTMAEFQHNIREIPKIILTKFGKSVTLLSIYCIQMYIIFDGSSDLMIHKLLFFFIGLHVIVESSITTKAVLNYLKYTEKSFNDLSKFEIFTKKLNKKLLQCNHLLFQSSNILSIVVIGILITAMFIDFQPYLIYLSILVIILMYYKILILKYIHKFKQ